MTEYVGPGTSTGLLVLGISVAWAAQIWGRIGRLRARYLVVILDVVAWLMIYFGIVGSMLMLSAAPMFTFPLLGILVLIVGSMLSIRFRQQEARSLFWQIGCSIRQGLPIADTVASFARERTDELGLRAAEAARGLSQGMPLATAFRQARWRLPTEILLSTRLDYPADELGATFQQTVERANRYGQISQQLLRQLLYLLLILFMTIWVTSFMFIRILPTLSTIAADFAMPLPRFTILMIDVTDAISNQGWVPLFLSASLVVLGIAAIAWGFYCLGWSRWEPLFLRRILRPHHSATILGALAPVAQSNRSLTKALYSMASVYPVNHIRKRLRSNMRAVNDGADLFESLAKTKLITRQMCTVLKSARTVGNLPWALREMSELTLQRQQAKAQLMSRSFCVAMTLIFALPTALLAVGFIQPLAALVLGLS